MHANPCVIAISKSDSPQVLRYSLIFASLLCSILTAGVDSREGSLSPPLRPTSPAPSTSDRTVPSVAILRSFSHHRRRATSEKARSGFSSHTYLNPLFFSRNHTTFLPLHHRTSTFDVHFFFYNQPTLNYQHSSRPSCLIGTPHLVSNACCVLRIYHH